MLLLSKEVNFFMHFTCSHLRGSQRLMHLTKVTTTTKTVMTCQLAVKN